MGDSRASVKIEFSIYGKDFKYDGSINWSPYNEYGVDTRIVEWFEECHRVARAHYDEQIYEAQAEKRNLAEENAEKAELARLKAKYPD